jgi:hypothetical protein
MFVSVCVCVFLSVCVAQTLNIQEIILYVSLL